jgi:hypothetical protein
VAAVPSAFGYVIAFPVALRWLPFGRQRTHALGALLLIYGSPPLLHALLDTNFNQESGKSQKWYAVQPSGGIALSDSGGFDPATGV